MSKIICDICGTSYPETTKQCPICGCVRPGDTQSVTNDVNGDGNVTTGYTHVKGGHFSKGTVKKRTKDVNQNVPVKKNDTPDNREPDKESRGLVVVAIILLLAVIGVVVYIAVRFFGPISNPNDNTSSTGNVQSNIACTDIILDTDTLTFDEAGEMLLLNVSVEPKNTSDILSYHSENADVVTVNSVGKITVVGEGTTNIVITCGNVTKSCTVVVQYPQESTSVENTEGTDSTGNTEGTTVTDPTTETEVITETLRLNRMDITFNSKGSSWNLYDGSIARNKITWTSDNTSIATFSDGVVVAVGNGTTTVHAEYDNQKVSCTIRCSFSDNSGIAGNGGVSEDGGSSGTASTFPFTGTIMVDGVNVRKGPGLSYEKVASKAMNEKVTLYEKKSDGQYDWYRIGTDQWIREDLFKAD